MKEVCVSKKSRISRLSTAGHFRTYFVTVDNSNSIKKIVLGNAFMYTTLITPQGTIPGKLVRHGACSSRIDAQMGRQMAIYMYK